MNVKGRLLGVPVLGLMVAILSACGSVAATIVPREATLQKLTAREYGLEPKSVSVTHIRSESDGPLVGSATVYYDAKINGQNKKCYVTTVMGAVSTPMCAKPGQALSKAHGLVTQ